MSPSLAESFVAAPRLAAPAEARRKLAALAAEPQARRLVPALGRERVRDLLLGLADHSPYLWTLVTEDPARLARLLARPPKESLDAIIAALAARRDEDEAQLMRALRRCKRETALIVALADIGGVWDVTEATEALTLFADAALGAALSFILRENARMGRLALDFDAPDPQKGSGVVVLALGKHGARELNYSSDIDLIVLYDAAAASIPEGVEPAPLFVRMTKALARLLQERTSDGYVLRVDLRLRPDPASTPVALSTISAYAYYETLGQNWERAALIKARPAAGDLDLGRRFLAELAPFIWRKYFDYAAIADIHAMKRQIHAVRGHDRVVVPGHDVKLGRGGIREVEFFVQTQQLIFGGRRPQMRGSRTLDMLRQLHEDKWVTAEAVEDLSPGLCLPAPRGAPAADDRRRADAATAVRAGGARAVRQVLRLCAAQDFRQRADPPSDARRAALCAPVRGGADAQRRHGQSRLHRRRRRPGDAGDPAPPRLPPSGIGGRDDSRLALRPAAGGAQRPRARGADRADPRAARGFRRLGRRRRGARRLRRGDGAYERLGRTSVDPALERARARTVRRRARLRPEARAGDRDPPARARLGDRSGPGKPLRGEPRGRGHAQAGGSLCGAGPDLRGWARPGARLHSGGDVPHRPQSAVGPARPRPRGARPTARLRKGWSERC